MSDVRLNHHAETFEEATKYFKQRAKQLQYEGYMLTDIHEVTGGAYAQWRQVTGTVYVSIFIYPKFRGQGSYAKIYKNIVEGTYPTVTGAAPTVLPILTTKDCGIVDFLKHKRYSFQVAGHAILESPEYKAIYRHYEDRKAKRSGVYLMNHIDEGISSITRQGYLFPGPDEVLLAAKAFCLHPIFQSDLELKDYMNDGRWVEGNQKAIVLAMEYRRVANAYLSTREIKRIKDIELSPLREVNLMLVADKIQNFKDFKAYHQATHPRSAELTKYFENWFDALNISPSEVQAQIDLLNQFDQGNDAAVENWVYNYNRSELVHEF